MRDDCMKLVTGRVLAGFLITLFVMLSGCATTNRPPGSQEDARKSGFQTGPGPYRFECNAPGGRYQESNVPITGDKLRVAGTMRFVELRSDPHWAAAATITFAGPTKEQPSMGLQVFVLPDEPNLMQLAIKGQGGAQDRSVFAISPVTDAWIPFEVKLDKAETLEVSIAGHTAHSAARVFEPTRVSLFCSTALVQFSNVTVENAH
jgi:hypothetical protein